MEWKTLLQTLERNKQWDTAIEFMEHVIAENPDDMDAYIAISYLIMNLLTEEDYDFDKFNDYAAIGRKYIDKSKEKFSENAEFLYYIAWILCIGGWIWASGLEQLEQKYTDDIWKKALQLDPSNPLFQLNYYKNLSQINLEDEKLLIYVKTILDPNSFIRQTLQSKGAIGEYILDVQMLSWAQDVVAKKQRYPLYKG